MTRITSSEQPPVKDRVQSYIDGVIDGTLLVGKFQRLCVERHLKDLLEGEKRGLYFDEDAGERICEFFEKYLHHTLGREWVGQPFILEPWECFILYVLFGWKRKADDYRRFRTAYLCISRKNGKSTLAAGVGLYLTIADGEAGAEVYSAATKKDQARIVHDEATRMIRRSPRLRRFIEIPKSQNSTRRYIHVPRTDSKYEPLSADTSTMDGVNPHGAIIDELHKHKRRDIFDLMVTAGIGRTQPLVFCITNAGDDREGVCWEQQSYGEKILTGVIEDDSYFSFITSIDEDDNWQDEDVWIKANPNLGVNIKIDRLRSEFKKAKESPAYEAAFRRYYLSQWWQRVNKYLRDDDWTATAFGDLPIEMKLDWQSLQESVVGRAAYCGLDLASTTDIAAFVMVVPVEDDYVVLPYFWTPDEKVVERSKDSVPYRYWVEHEYMYATPGNLIDYSFIREKVNELGKIYRIKEIAYDSWNSSKLVTELTEDGFQMVTFGQGYASMSPATKELLTQVLGKHVIHGNHPVLRWMAGNLTVTMDPSGNVKPMKDKTTEKIDGMVALIMGLDRAVKNEEADSVYEERGLEVL